MQNIFKRLLILFACAVVLVPVAASAAEDGNIARATLENGLEVVIVRNSLAPVVSVQVNYKAGSNEAPHGFPGTAHAQEHMMFRGAPGLSGDQLASLIAALGGEFNADTQQTVTQYFLTVPSDYLDVALHIEALRMKGVLDSEKLWRKERGAIEQEVVQDLSNPEYILETRLLASLFAGTPYEHDALGTQPSFDKTTGRMLKKFYDDWYAPNNAVLVIVGDIDPTTTMKKVKKLFTAIPSRTLPSRPPVNLQPLKPSTIELNSDLPYGLAIVAYRLPGYDSPDYAAGQVLSDVLSSQRGNLYGMVPEGKALSADFDDIPLPKIAAGYASAAFPKGGDGHALIKNIKGIIADYLKKGIPSELVEAAKRREIADKEFRKNSVTGLADAWSQAVAIEGRTSPDDDIEAIGRVTPADVDRVAREYLDNETAVTSILEPQTSGKPVTAKSMRGKESFAPARTKPVKLPGWAKKAFSQPEKVTSATRPSVFMLANGLRLIVRPTRISRTVSVYGQIRNRPQLQEPDGKDGVSDVLDSLFSYGTTTLDRLSYRKALDDIAADASAGTSFSLQVLSRYFPRGLQLLADNMLHPALPDQAFNIVRRETAAELAGRMQSPDYLAGRALRKGLYPPGDPMLRKATPQTVSSLSLADVKKYYAGVFRPDLTTIVVIGDISPKRAREEVERCFGGWKAVGPRPATTLPKVPLNKASVVAVPDSSRVQDEVRLVETLGLDRRNPDYYPLQVGLHVLSGAFYATRLYRDLREQTGLVYMVDAFIDAGKTRSLFGVVYGCDPRNVSKARSVIRRNLIEMRKLNVTGEELKQARTLLLRQIPLSRASTGSIALGMLGLVEKDLPLDEPERAAARYRKISAQQVKKAFARWIRPDAFVQVTTGPEPK